MKKVGLAVVTYKDNFGSMLQTYATQYVIKRQGFDTRIFRIEGIHKSVYIRKVLFYLRRLLKPDEFKYLFENLKSRSRKKISADNDEYAENMKIRHKKYKEFASQYLEFFPLVKGWNKLKKLSVECDSVVVGSDQLWRPSNIAGGYYTLDFVPDNVKKIAYSTSFGVSEMLSFQKRKAARFLKRFDYISVRENSGRKIVSELIDRDIPVVCDPTMLLNAEEWMEIQKEEPIYKEKYILCYFLGDNQLHREFARKLREKTGYKIIGLLHGATYISKDDSFADIAPYDVGPCEFVNLVRNAEYICSDSFHCAAFSILNQKKFFAFRRYEDHSNFSTNDRLHTLLEWTGLQDRMLYGDERIEETIEEKINYRDVLLKVEQKRKESFEYLKNALG